VVGVVDFDGVVAAVVAVGCVGCRLVCELLSGVYECVLLSGKLRL
jgi:hypothetical protein